MLNDSSSIEPPANEDETKTKKELFSFLHQENLIQEEFEANMNNLLLANFKEKGNKSLLLIEQKSIILMIDFSIKYNNQFLLLNYLLIWHNLKIWVN